MKAVKFNIYKSNVSDSREVKNFYFESSNEHFLDSQNHAISVSQKQSVHQTQIRAIDKVGDSIWHRTYENGSIAFVSWCDEIVISMTYQTPQQRNAAREILACLKTEYTRNRLCQQNVQKYLQTGSTVLLKKIFNRYTKYDENHLTQFNVFAYIDSFYLKFKEPNYIFTQINK